MNIVNEFSAAAESEDGRGDGFTLASPQLDANGLQQSSVSDTGGVFPSDHSPFKRWLKVTLFRMPADSRVRIFFRDAKKAAWAMGDASAHLVGVSLETTTRSVPLKLNSFIINAHELIFSSYAACDEMKLEICVRGHENTIHGYVDLPLGASVTFQSEVDRTSLIGFSSFALSF
ncbi:hypothetical protein [Trinickia sp.]|uniref:hypothetical protein n=1 Tax=Trinickia sp. TaxID=2571163 RepID=UPI003F7E76FF